MRDALDLCVGCKGCRRECPTGVDMAKMKIEFHAPVAARARADAAGARDRVPAALGAVGGAVALAREPARRAARPRAVVRSAGPACPRSARCRAGGATRSRGRCAATSWTPERADVILFVDTFTQYFEPENAHAALEVLRGGRVPRRDRGGVRTTMPTVRGRCAAAGRSWPRGSSTKRSARRAAWSGALAPHAARGAAIVGLEPSCLLTLRDEFLVLGLGEAAQTLAERDVPVRGIPRARVRGDGRLALPLGPLARNARAAARPLPPEGVRCGGAGGGGPEAGPRTGGRARRVELLRHGRQLRLRGGALRRLACGWPSCRCCPPCARPRRTR